MIEVKDKKMATDFTASDIIEALRAARGMRTKAAKRLNISYNTLRKYIDNSEIIQEAEKEIRLETGDDMELTALNHAMGKMGKDGKWERLPNTTMLIFLMKTSPIMRERGYLEHRALTGADGGPIAMTWADIVGAGDDNNDEVDDYDDNPDFA